MRTQIKHKIMELNDYLKDLITNPEHAQITECGNYFRFNPIKSKELFLKYGVDIRQYSTITRYDFGHLWSRLIDKTKPTLSKFTPLTLEVELILDAVPNQLATISKGNIYPLWAQLRVKGGYPSTQQEFTYYADSLLRESHKHLIKHESDYVSSSLISSANLAAYTTMEYRMGLIVPETIQHHIAIED